jgi:hypothetical protein
MHAYRAGQGSGRTRVLYLFRSPSNMKVGRTPLDAEVVEALEHTHPDLAFDWAGMMREPGATSRPSEPQDRHRQDRQARRPPRSAPAASGTAKAPPVEAPPMAPPIAMEDESLLGRVLGAHEAARLRGRYTELQQRIIRRAPTPEERDRLTDRLARLNPDEWPDEATIRQTTATAETEWSAIAEELPRRRRGRRGGRRNDRDTAAVVVAGIAAPERDPDGSENEAREHEAEQIRVAGGADDAGSSGGDGAEAVGSGAAAAAHPVDVPVVPHDD